jgi:hypothetical protein
MKMAGTASTAKVVQKALSLLDVHPEIPYVGGGGTLKGMDCQGLVEWCINQAGGKAAYSGSNDMWRNACAYRATLKDAKAAGKLVPGALLFIWAEDGEEPAKYQGDGEGNAYHIGVYCGAPKAEVIHASYSRGMVAPSTLANAWTHVAWFKGVDYGGEAALSTPAEDAVQADTQTQYIRVVTSDGNGLNMRKTPKGQRMLSIPFGEVLPVLDAVEDWYRVPYTKDFAGEPTRYVGWVDANFTRPCDEHGQYMNQKKPSTAAAAPLEGGTGQSQSTHELSTEEMERRILLMALEKLLEK